MSTDKKPTAGQSPSSHASGQHRLQLDEHLRRNTPKEVKAAQVAYAEAQSSTPPPHAVAAVVQTEGVKEMGDAARQLTESVDKVCEALVMVFGKIAKVSDESHGQSLLLRSLMRLMAVVAVIQAIVCVVTITIAWMTYDAGQTIDRTSVEQAETAKALTKLTRRVDSVAKSAEETKKTVDEVKKTADETPTVQLLADPDKPGEAVVRIVPPKSESADADINLPPPTSKKPPPTAPVEIPLKVDEARAPRE